MNNKEKEYAPQYRAAHRKESREYAAQYRAAHPEKVKEYQDQYRENNRSLLRLKAKTYYKMSPTQRAEVLHNLADICPSKTAKKASKRKQ